MRTLTPFQTIEEIRQRSVEAILGLSGINHPALAAEIRRKFGGRDIAAGALLQEPIIEAAFPFIEAAQTLASLSGKLLHPKVVDALDQPGDPRIGRDWHPYQHQLEAWQHLTDSTPQSTLITSGTGSGKTECFMVPLLDDLVRESETQQEPLQGVRAIALYPLNALIASQQERLGKWTRPFRGKIRYALYNGEMPEDIEAARERDTPEQVLCRRTLRSNPPPILVTNVTMLEYLTVRRKDRPVLEASQGKLRWIILDEAHSYTGSNAAEIALLLRRVLLAFGVTPGQVRFVATSATIGEGTEVTEALRRFLRDVSGAAAERVQVVTGQRRIPQLPQPDKDKQLHGVLLPELDATSAFELLSRNPVVQKQVTELTRGPRPWSDLARELSETGLEPESLALALARSEKAGERLLPLRVHAFHRAIPGLWACLNQDCSARIDGWPFGGIVAEAVGNCPSCGGRVFPVVSCRSCGEPFLDAVEKDFVLQPRDMRMMEDEFSRDSEEEAAASTEDDERLTAAPGIERLVATRSLPQARPLHVDPHNGVIADQPGEALLALSTHDRTEPESCPACLATATDKQPRVLWPFRFGAPAILSNASPLLLESAEPSLPNPAAERRLPAEGRQLLSFTDSRQGTARFSAKLQSAAERNYVRAQIYFAAQDCLRGNPESAAILADLDNKISILRAQGGPGAAAVIPWLEQQREGLAKPCTGVPWKDILERLAERDEIAYWMRFVWRKRDSKRFGGDMDGPDNLAEMMLLRELSRRTKQANSLETMGLASLRFEVIENLVDTRTPDALRSRGKSIQDWRDFLYLCLTIAVRDKFAIKIDKSDAHWLQPHVPPKRLIAPKSIAASKSEIRWPQVLPNYVAQRGTLPRLLEVALGLNAEDRGQREIINDLLENAWKCLKPLFVVADGGDGFRLDLSKALVAPVEKRAWRCPITRRVLDTTFCNYSPYGLRTGVTRGMGALAEPIELPRHPAPFLRELGDEERVRAWLREDAHVIQLREAGLWGNLHDQIALGSPYVRSAEHSAQQPSRRLRDYEAEFRRGEINVLNCSTTMEMGVDIGSVSTVMMTNVPPSIANYRQRVGRAGRRRQATALAFTYCRDAPIEWEAFRTPVRFLSRTVAAPRVSLDSSPLVQRHVNALLLAAFVRGQNGDTTTTNAGAFYGFPADLKTNRLPDPPSAIFRDWLAKPSTQGEVSKSIRELVRGSVLESGGELFEEAIAAINKAEAEFQAEWDGLQSQAAGLDRDAARKAIGFQLKRLCGEFLLSDLANRGVLPGHGFPTAVVQFVHKDEPDYDEEANEEGSPLKRRFFASRNLDQAIRDYAPGADVVIDGLVYRSAGVTLNWKRPAGELDVRDIQSLGFIWRCESCGAAGTLHHRTAECLECGATGDTLRQYEYLRPAGFAAERQPAHADADTVSYVPPEPPIVAARGADWQPLRVPELGRLRTSPNGLVFYSSTGGERGYRICLHCGRAQAEGMLDSPSFADHRPLRYTKADDDGKCPGAARPFAIKQGIRLGHDVRTDVFELQINRLDQVGAAWAFGSALRTALTRELGIELSELGVWVEPRRTALGGREFTVFLFDHAAGGAGFSTRAKDLFPKLLNPIRELLECKVEGCVTGCSSCVLTSDLHDQQRLIDRQAALVFVKGLHLLAKPDHADIFASDAVFSDILVDELTAAKGDVTVWCESLELAGLDDGAFLRLAASQQRLGCSTILILGHTALSTMDDAMRLRLRDLSIRHNIGLRRGSAPRFKNGSIAIAAVRNHGTGEIWATRDSTAPMLDSRWGVAAELPILRGKWATKDDSEELPKDILNPHADSVFVSFTNECDGLLSGFGDRLLDFVKPSLQKVGGWRPGGLVSVEYSDRYLKSPLSVRLACEFIGALVRALGDIGRVHVSLVSEPLRPDSRFDDRAPWQAFHDWRSDEIRMQVVEKITSKIGFHTSLTLRREKHAREMVLAFDDASSLTLVFDQGFGSWVAPKGVRLRFNFDEDSQKQAMELVSFNAVVNGPDFPSYIVVYR